MSAFDKGDEVLIEQLIQDGMSLHDIAEKWSVNYKSLVCYCSAKGVKLPKRSPEKNGCHGKRIETEAGRHKSETVKRIIKLSKTHCARDIAVMVKRSTEYVSRMIDVFVKKETNNRHSQRVNAVRALAKSKDIPAAEACVMLGVTYNQYCYSARRIGLHGNKKAPQ